MSHADLQSFFMDDHRRVDTTWADFENAADKGPADCASKWQAFLGAMHGNLKREEEVLFPAFEAETGMSQGPTTVMRMEHAQMRAVMEQMATAAASEDWSGVMDHGDTLMMLIQQHNMKEEGMLFPMAHRALAAQWPTLAEQL